ncbi:MAG: PaaX family transcriptional regulator C-terminal domain-containing protein [Verrucomicrobiota bacterium]
MKRLFLNKKGISPGVLRRQICAEMVDLLGIAIEGVATRGKAWSWNRSYPRMTAYRQALYRLRRDGLIARRDMCGGSPTIKLTSEGRRNVSAEIIPERFWNQRWDGCWYILMYDVPERERRYRDALNHFLTRLRMGCLQKSVFVSVRDIRPMFYDLDIAAAVAEYANLFEARTVFGQSDAAVVARAWDFDRLWKIQADYIEACQARLRRPFDAIAFSAVLASMRAELAEYRGAMRNDPLLPKPLWPSDYLGPQVVAMFRRRMRRLAGKIVGWGM